MDNEIKKEMLRAVKNGDLDAIDNLINSNEELLNISLPIGSWLHIAAACGNYHAVEFLIKRGIDVNIYGSAVNCNALRIAAFGGHLDIVKLLHKNGSLIDVSEPNKNPLFAAISCGHTHIVKYLVETGMDIAVHYQIGRLKKVDAYEYARQYGQTEIANYLKGKSEQSHG